MKERYVTRTSANIVAWRLHCFNTVLLIVTQFSYTVNLQCYCRQNSCICTGEEVLLNGVEEIISF